MGNTPQITWIFADYFCKGASDSIVLVLLVIYVNILNMSLMAEILCFL